MCLGATCFDPCIGKSTSSTTSSPVCRICRQQASDMLRTNYSASTCSRRIVLKQAPRDLRGSFVGVSMKLTFDEMLKKLSAAAETVNRFSSEHTQERVVQALITALEQEESVLSS